METLRSTAGQIQDCQNASVAQLESLTTDTAKLAIQMMKGLEVSTSHFLKIKIEMQQMSVMADCYFSGLSSLMDCKLNVDMVNATSGELRIKKK